MKFYRKCVVVIVMFVLLSICENTSAHPQCLDARAPFHAVTNLTFCPNYSDFGCCTIQDDNDLEIKFTNIRKRIPQNRNDLWTTCSERIRTLLCQRCSPFAAHIFETETSSFEKVIIPRAFPGLCLGYCTEFLAVCEDVIEYYMEEFISTNAFEKEALLSYVAEGHNAFCANTALIDVDYCYPELLSNPILNGNISIETVTKEGCICMEQVPNVNLRNPVFLKHANDGSNRLFVGEQIGLVHIIYKDGKSLPEPFLDIQSLIHTTISKGDERGMLGMDFHPDYNQNGLFYVYYSTPLNAEEISMYNYDHKIRVSEFRVNAGNPNVAELPSSYHRTIIEIYEPFWNHNGGEILFGDDNYMYLFVGDGGQAGDTLRAGQDLSTMLGKVLRIDVNTKDTGRGLNYGIPPDNPFISVPGALPEIYAYGVRNIWRCGKDRGDPITGHGKGRIVCGDVGQSNREELDLLVKGANYGWNLMEGTEEFCTTSNCQKQRATAQLTAPIHDYNHTVGKSITGGHFYRGCHSPNMNGYYIYGDFMTARLFRLLEDPVTKKWENKDLTMCGLDRCTPPLQNIYSHSIIAFGEDEDGEVYMLSTWFASTTAKQGSIYKIVDPSRRGHPDTCRSARVSTPTSPVPVTTTPKSSATTAPATKTTAQATTTRRISQPTTEKDVSRGNIPTITGMLYCLTLTMVRMSCMVL